MKCKSCGVELDDNAKFCTNCGSAVEPDISKSGSGNTNADKEDKPKFERVEAEVVGNARDTASNTTANASGSGSSSGGAAGASSGAGSGARSSEGSTDYSGNPTFNNVYNNTNPSGSQNSDAHALAIASLVCGIVSIFLCCCSWRGVVCAVAGIVLGIVAIKKDCPTRGLAIAGIVCGCVGLVFIIAFTIMAVTTEAVFHISTMSAHEMEHFIENMMEEIFH